jgi:nucleoside-diphosphate-sugar epimerase
MNENKKSVLVTGGNGFIGGYLIQELLQQNYKVISLDNFSKYGKCSRSYDDNPNYKIIEGDVKDSELLLSLLRNCDYLIAGASMIGGISYIHEFAYDLLSENEKITCSTFDAAIKANKFFNLKKIIVISSSMVYETCETYPFSEGMQLKSSPPLSTYGFQKLSCEYFAKGAYEQYKLPYTIVRPFNCIGIGEKTCKYEKDILSGNIKLALSHVVPDIIQKILKGQYPLHILGEGNQIRHYTYGGDIARGIRMCMEHKNALNEDFNISSDRSTSVIELSNIIWNKIHPNLEFKFISDPPYKWDVQKRVPNTIKSYKLLGYKSKTSLEDSIDEIIPWIKDKIELDEF